MKNKILLFIAVIIILATYFYMVTTTSRRATLLLVNGKVYTMDGNSTVAEAIAISGDRILASGTTAELTSRYSAGEIIDLQGKTVMPGFVDGHAHLLGEGTLLMTMNLDSATSPEEIAGLVAERTRLSRAEQWITGRGWDQNRWPSAQFPVHGILDRVSPNNPVVLSRIDGHAIWVNQKVLDIAHITAQTPDIDGGKIYRDRAGNPTGVLVDNAIDLVDNVMPDLQPEEIEQHLKAAMDECARFGLTEVHDMGVDLEEIGIYKKMIDDGNCPVRIYAAIGDAIPSPSQGRHENAWQYYLGRGPEIDYGNGMLTVRAVKLYMDGALGSRGAALFDSYTDEPGNRGLTLMHETQLDSICSDALQKGFQVCIHAIGDRANHIVLNEYQKALLHSPGRPADARWRIEHAQILGQTDIPRFASLGIIPAMQPTHATSDMYWAESRVGPERIKGAYAWKSLIRGGSIIIGGSDFPVESVNPLWGFYAAITRMDRNGEPAGGWRPEEQMSRLEAAKAFTVWPAFGAFQEDRKGTLEPGKWADLTVCSKDIMQIPPQEILRTDIEMTIVGGKIVYRKNSLP